MKELARYNGKVLRLAIPPQASSVRLTEVSTGNVVETDAVSETLIRAGLKQDSDFVIIIKESPNGHQFGVITKDQSNTETDFNI
jgi:hypothetical protein